MALGGGVFLVQNKVLPGTYINFVSIAKASATLGDRGYVAMGLELDWGSENEVMTITNAEFQKNSTKLCGYDYGHDKLKDLRELFANAQTLYAYRLNSGGAKASNTFATAKFAGIRGNDFKVAITKNIDDDTKFDVALLLGTSKVDTQTVGAITELVGNDFVDWKTSATLAETAATPLNGGTNGTVDGAAHQGFLDKIEAYSYNILAVAATDEPIKGLYINFAKRMRDEVGAKFQLVLHNKAADFEGVINVKNKVADTGAAESSLVYWVAGLQASCPVNKSCLNRKYDGEYTVDTNYTQAQLIAAIKAGEFALHRVGADVRVLSDVNSLVTTSDTKGDVFKENQTIRVIDQIANDIATLFNTKYLGVVPNDAAGRISLWADIVKHHEQLQDIRAIESFSDKDVTVEQGDTKKAVLVNDKITVVNAMAQLYMIVKVA